MKRYKFTARSMINTMPFQVTPHLEQRVWSDNVYLPDHIRTISDDQRKLLSLDDSPRVAWRSGVPVVPATSFKGSLRHLLTEYQTRYINNLSVLVFNYLALGGIKGRGKAPIANSPNNRQTERDRFPLVSLFGASTPVFVRGAIKTFPDLVPKSKFQLEEIPIIRTDPAVRDEATIRCNPDDIDKTMTEMSESSSVSKAADKNREAAYKAVQAAREAGIPADMIKAEAALEAAWKAVRENEKKAMVQTGQLHSFFVIPAGQEFSHEFRLEAEDHEIGLLLIGLREFGLGGGLLGGQLSRGAGGGFAFTYEISVLDGNAFVPIGSVSNEEVDSELEHFIEAYESRADEWCANIMGMM